MKSKNEIDVVLNTQYGGFSVTKEMALWLIHNKNWTLIPEEEYYENVGEKKWPINSLYSTKYG